MDFTDPYAIEQKRAQAALLRAQQEQEYEAPRPAGMAGNVYVGTHPFQHMAQMLRSYKGAQKEKEATTQLQDIGARKNQAIADALRQSQEFMAGKPAGEERKQMFVADDAGSGEMTMGSQVTPAVAPNPMAAYTALLNAPDADLRKTGMTGLQRFNEQQMEQAQAKQKQDQQRQLWEQSGGNPQAFLAAGGDFDFANNMVSGQNMGKAKVARTIETTDPRTGRKINVMVDEYGNRVGEAMPVYTPPTAPKAPNVIQTANGPMILNSDGTARPITTQDGRPVQGAKSENVTEGERKAGSLLTRLRGSQAQLADALKANPDAATPSLLSQGLSNIGMETAANVANSSARQRVEAAQLDLLDSALTLGTGAAYTREQLEGYRKSYFPQIGDSPETVRDKEERLKNIIAAAEVAAGRAEPQSVPRFGPQTRPGPTPQNLPQTNAGPSVPAVGTVKNGYVFQGGDPSKPQSWKKQ